MNTHRSNALRGLAIKLILILCGLPACGDGGGSGGGNGGNGGSAGGEPPDLSVFDEAQGPVDRSHVSYVGNLQAKVDAGEWTLGEGLVETLQMFAGERDAQSVLRHAELLTHEGTGIFRMADEYLENGDDADAQASIGRLLSILVFSVEELEEMAGIGPKSGLITAKGGVENCLELFSEHDSVPPGVGVCLEQESIFLEAKRYRVFFPAGSLPQAGWTEAHVELALDAIRDAVATYSELGTMPEVALIFSAAKRGGVWGNAYPNPEKTCGVAIYTSLQSKPEDEFKQLLAHELAHCFQAETHPKQHTGMPYTAMDWHFEGLAEYWSNVVYPDVNLEWRFVPTLEKIELKSSMVFHRAYENFLFFQYLGNRIGDDGILRLVGSLPQAGSDVLDQQEALADYSGMAQTYHEFVEAVTDGRVEDSSKETIPFTPMSVFVGLHGKADPYVSVPVVRPFSVVRLHLGVSEHKQASLDFDGTGPVIGSSGPASQEVSAGIAGLVTESVRDAKNGRRWYPGLPYELPEDNECGSNRLMFVATSVASGAGFDLGVSEFVDVDDCCLHGRWVVNNEDMAELWTAGLGWPASVGGQLSATFGTDGYVRILWGGYTTSWTAQLGNGESGSYSATISGGGSQAYTTRNGNLLSYGGPALTPTQSENSVDSSTDPYVVELDTWYGDEITTQFYECEGDTLNTIVPGPGASFDIEWSRSN